MIEKSRWISVLGLLAFLTIACGIGYQVPRIASTQDDQTISNNGERIYFTAANEDGERIEYRGGPNFGGMMMGSYLTCAACHGLEARGGTHVMHMQVMDAPDIRIEALSSEAGEHGDGENHGEAGEYTLDDFRQAVVEGKHPDGEALSRDMPRWEVSEQDLVDLFEFLKSLP